MIVIPSSIGELPSGFYAIVRARLGLSFRKSRDHLVDYIDAD